MTKNRIIFAISMLSLLFVGYADRLTGTQVSMMLFYAVPILLTSWNCGKNEGTIVAFTAAAFWLLANYLNSSAGSY